MAKSRKAIKVRCIETGEVYNSYSEAGKAIGVNHNSVRLVVIGKQESIKGLHFEAVEENVQEGEVLTPTVQNEQGETVPVIDSREVARMMERPHKEILRYIEGSSKRVGILPTLLSTKWCSTDYFIESSYLNNNNKKCKCYLVTKKGCELLGNKQNGEKEIWRDIEGYEGYYMVSNLGNVKSLNYHRTGKERLLKPRKDKGGYLRVALCKDGKEKDYYVHRLAANAFLENSKNLPQVNHIDQNKENNCINNLEFCSSKYNCNYGDRSERQAEKLRGKKQSEEHVRKVAEKHCKPIFGINKVSGLIIEFSSAREAEKHLGIANQSICACCKGRLKSCGGYAWYYASTE